MSGPRWCTVLNPRSSTLTSRSSTSWVDAMTKRMTVRREAKPRKVRNRNGLLTCCYLCERYGNRPTKWTSGGRKGKGTK